MLRTTCNKVRTTRKMLRTTCNKVRTTRKVLRTTYNKVRTTCRNLPTTYIYAPITCRHTINERSAKDVRLKNLWNTLLRVFLLKQTVAGQRAEPVLQRKALVIQRLADKLYKAVGFHGFVNVFVVRVYSVFADV